MGLSSKPPPVLEAKSANVVRVRKGLRAKIFFVSIFFLHSDQCKPKFYLKLTKNCLLFTHGSRLFWPQQQYFTRWWDSKRFDSQFSSTNLANVKSIMSCHVNCQCVIISDGLVLLERYKGAMKEQYTLLGQCYV